jgi:integrase
MTALRKRDYLYQRRNSPIWYVRTQGGPNGNTAVSLRTADRATAEVLALPLIQKHKTALLASRPQLEWTQAYRYVPGQEYTITPDAEGFAAHVGMGPPAGAVRVIATAETLVYLNHNGAVVGTEPNGYLTQKEADPATLSPAQLRKMDEGNLLTIRGALQTMMKRPAAEQPPAKSGDDTLFETYLKNAKHGAVTGYAEKEARAVWELFKALTKGKALKDCTREDGRTLANYFADKGLKSASIKKKVGWLRNVVSFGIREGRLTFNPFIGVVPNRKDALKKVALNDADMELCRANLHALSNSDQLLFRFLSLTGARLGEAFQVVGEQIEKRIRACHVGTKTEASNRTIPFPEKLLPLLPAKIDGPLFDGDANAASKRLNAWLRASGISDPAKTIHSLRHRAIEVLRELECPDNISRRLFGHAKDVHEGYGGGILVLKKWCDRIGGI